MQIKFFNTLTRRKEVFKPMHKGVVFVYTCGPTVYDYAHIGNFRTYVWQDLLKRWLLYRGFKVKHIMNLTDVDDKTIKGSRAEGIPLKQFTARYTKAFFGDMRALNILPADKFPRATAHIKEMIDLIKKLVKAGYAYKGEDDSVYYDISKFKGYGKLSKLKVKELKAGARVKQDQYTKEEVQDFALWKAWDPADGNVYWQTKIGKGRPGWHIECSAMSMKYLGNTLDIHTGGVDLMFPHHENEIAQSEAATGRQFVNYWLHAEHLMVESRKMSKSLGNFYTLHNLLDKGYEAKAIRYLLLSTHYKQQLNFTFKGLQAASKTIESLLDFIRKLKEVRGKSNPAVKKLITRARESFERAMDNNLDIRSALAAMFGFVRKINKLMADNKISKEDAKQTLKLMLDFDKVLGLELAEVAKVKITLPAEAKCLIAEREKAREQKNFARSDEIRKQLLEEFNIILEDTPKGVKWKIKKK